MPKTGYIFLLNEKKTNHLYKAIYCHSQLVVRRRRRAKTLTLAITF